MSKKLLIIANFRLRNEEEFKEIKDNFLNNNYEIYEIEGINNREFRIEILKNVLEEKEYKNYERVSVISNIRDVLFCWYRIYNSIADDFIFFIDKYNYRLMKDEFYESLSNFDNIFDEKLNGKVYLNLKSWNYEIVKEILINPKNFYNIDLIWNIDFNKNRVNNKNKLNKVYSYREKESNFDLGFKNKMSINMDTKNKSLIIRDIYEAMNNNPEIMPFYFIFSYRNENNNKENLNSIFVKYFFDLKIISNDKADEIILKIMKVAESNLFKFKDGIDVLSFCAFYKEIKIDIGDKIIEYISNDKENIDKHYACMINILFMQYGEKIKVSKEFHHKIADEIIKIGKGYNCEIKRENINNEDKIKIAIIVDQLMNVKHSTAKATLDYAINIKKYYPNYEMCIFVEDNFFNNKDENIMIYYTYSDISSTISNNHTEYLKNHKVNIPIIYSEIEETKKKRVEKMLSLIYEFNPSIVLNINNAYSLSMEYLSKEYKSYYLTLGLINWQDNQIYNFYFEGVNKEILPQYDNNVIMKTKAISFEDKEAIYKREKFGLKEKDFIMIGVSLMPEADFSEDYIDEIVNILNANELMKLIIVGSDKLSVVSRKYPELIANKIVFIKYEQNLGALYQICDIYINPPRDGGGYSLAEAMFYKLPILSLEGFRAGDAWVGKENTIKNMCEYKKEIDRLFVERKYYEEKSILFKNRIKSLSFKNHLQEIFEVIINN